MKGQWQIYISDPNGNRLGVLDTPAQITITKVANDVGTITGLWSTKTFKPEWLALDNRIEARRAPLGSGNYSLNDGAFGFLRNWQRYQDGNVDTISATFLDPNHLLQRRLVAYLSGTSTSDKTAAADDMMKAVVRENLGALAVDTARDLTAAGFTVAADQTAGVSVTKKGMAERIVLDVLREISDQSAADDPLQRVYFIVDATSPTAFEFRTAVGHFGADRSLSAAQHPVVASPELGSLTNARYDYVGEAEVNYVYAGGVGTKNNRLISTAADAARMGVSVFGRCEGWSDCRNVGVVAADVAAEAKVSLVRGQPQRQFVGTLVDVPDCRYGREWHFGDRISVMYGGETFSVVLARVVITLDSTGNETIQASLEVT